MIKNHNTKAFKVYRNLKLIPTKLTTLKISELPVIAANHPSTKMPERKVSFMSKLSDMFSIEKQATPTKIYQTSK